MGPLIELDRSVILKHEWKQKGPRKSEGSGRKGCPGGLQGYLMPGRTAHSQNQEQPEHWELEAELDPPAVDRAGIREWCRRPAVGLASCCMQSRLCAGQTATPILAGRPLVQPPSQTHANGIAEHCFCSFTTKEGMRTLMEGG